MKKKYSLCLATLLILNKLSTCAKHPLLNKMTRSLNKMVNYFFHRVQGKFWLIRCLRMATSNLLKTNSAGGSFVHCTRNTVVVFHFLGTQSLTICFRLSLSMKSLFILFVLFVCQKSPLFRPDFWLTISIFVLILFNLL